MSGRPRFVGLEVEMAADYAPFAEARGTTLEPSAAICCAAAYEEGAPSAPPTSQIYSLRKPGTSMSSSETLNLRMSVSSAEIRGRLS